jgi:ADP-ribose pyrophosphatase YjhB (NUDIX family)
MPLLPTQQRKQGEAVIERVRAILITPCGGMLAIRRDKPGQPTYWVLPGGHVDPSDADLEAALVREIREEIVGEPQIASLLHIAQGDGERQYFYLARIASWSFGARSGPEFSEAGRGGYELEEIPLTASGLESIDLKPARIADLLRDVVISERDLFTMPDLRTAPAVS